MGLESLVVVAAVDLFHALISEFLKGFSLDGYHQVSVEHFQLFALESDFVFSHGFQEVVTGVVDFSWFECENRYVSADFSGPFDRFDGTVDGAVREFSFDLFYQLLDVRYLWPR